MEVMGHKMPCGLGHLRTHGKPHRRETEKMNDWGRSIQDFVNLDDCFGYYPFFYLIFSNYMYIYIYVYIDGNFMGIRHTPFGSLEQWLLDPA